MRECDALPYDRRVRSAPVCDKNCFECPYDDCIMDELDATDYKELSMIDREILNPKNAAQRKVAAQQKAYREANREKVAAQQKAYREANREKVAAQQKAYREAKKQKAKGGEIHA